MKKLPKRFSEIEKHKLAPGRKFMVTMMHFWGCGKTIAAAIKQIKDAGGNFKAGSTHCFVSDVDKSCRLDGMGNYVQDCGKDKPKQLAELKGK